MRIPREILDVGMSILRLSGGYARKKLAEKATPYVIPAVLGASWVGLLPKREVTAEEPTRCSACGRRKHRGTKMTIIDIPQTGGQIKVCKRCEQRTRKELERGVDKFMERLRHK